MTIILPDEDFNECESINILGIGVITRRENDEARIRAAHERTESARLELQKQEQALQAAERIWCERYDK